MQSKLIVSNARDLKCLGALRRVNDVEDESMNLEDLYAVTGDTVFGAMVIMSEERKFTLEELKGYDGKAGKPAYFAYKGKVYDVSESVQWFDGSHYGEHFAGVDLTEEVASSPHGEEVLERFKVVGVLVS